jgi:hypothetical protein
VKTLRSSVASSVEIMIMGLQTAQPPLCSEKTPDWRFRAAYDLGMTVWVGRQSRFQPFRIASDRNVSEVAALHPEISRIVAKTL